ncbi:helix-turn-helix transcriptional regulator [Micromonospora sp. CPCC 206060]|uniref:helix-turn-helix domain-containing protein n=1 Tax=Micromonospora sp. CPCC 206060 TaxID=3122406 RepID=UPI002FF1C9BF
MTEETTGSTVPRRQLGRFLTELREEAGVTLDGAADLLQCSRQKVWRMEKGLVPMRAPDVTVLCDRYDAPEGVRAVLLGLVRETRSRGWWHAYGDAIPQWFSLYVSLEGAASGLRLYNAELIPGLLQTREYITALYQLNRPETPEPERDRTIAVRMQRQQILVRRLPAAPEVDVVLSEAVLRRPVPDRKVWLGQLAHLRDLGLLPNVRVRVLPSAAGPRWPPRPAPSPCWSSRSPAGSAGPSRPLSTASRSPVRSTWTGRPR